MLKIWLTLSLFPLFMFNSQAQLVINEASNRNYSQISDEDGEYNDWIEIYNNTSASINLNGWSLSDSRNNPEKWKFAPSPLSANEFVLVHASAKSRNQLTASLNWESAVLAGDEFKYTIPDANTSDQWTQPDFNDTAWKAGKGGFGYGDDDDQTTVAEGTTALFVRKVFTVSDASAIKEGKLHVDYDDGFVAWLNGVEIARSNVNGAPDWNSIATSNHEAVMYSGGSPEKFDIDESVLASILKNGENVLAMASLNIGNSSSDFTLIPFLSFGIVEGISMFRDVPVWFKQMAPGNLHTNFKLQNSGEKIFLALSGVIVDSLDVDVAQRDQSLGRITDGASAFGIFTSATPGQSNNTSRAYTNGYASKPKLSMPAGLYPSGLELTMSSDESNVVIRYTIDGSEPIETSPQYNTSLKIATTRTIRARAFSADKLPSKITTATYIIKDEYSIPVLAVTANREDIFGANGIFTRWQDNFEIPAYMEYFDKDKKLAFHQDAGMQIDGGAGGSRSLPQHSFRMEPGNGALGDGDLNYKLMPRRPNRTNYPSFYVRNGSNQHLRLPYKDGLEVTALGRNTFTYYSAYHPIAVYINGEFFGIYELREKINDDYLVDNYQMNIDSLDFLGVSYFKGQQLEALRGSIQPFLDDYNNFLQMNVNDADYLQDIDQFLDIQSYTDYIIAESWVGNNDWPYNNIKLFRCSSTGFRWQWAINDLEWALNPNGWTTSSFDHIQYMLNQGTGNYYTAFWFNMTKNKDYKAYFVNRFADLMNTSYDFSVIGPLENEMFNELNAEMDHEFQRWGSSNITNQMATFKSNHEIFRGELSKRSDFVRDDLQSHFNLQRKVNVTLDVEPKGAGSIQISTITPANYPWEGIYFGNVEIQLEALPNLGYEFVNWDPNAFIDDISEALVSGTFKSSKMSFKAFFRESATEDAGVLISEINYKSGVEQSSPDWIELCNYSTNAVNLKNWSFNDSDTTHRFVFKNDLILAANERIVVCNDLDLFNSAYPGAPVYSYEFDFGLGTPSDKVVLFNAEKELVLSVQYSDHYPWALSDDQSGRTLELRSPGGNYSQAGSWFRGCVGGSPGTSYQFCDEKVNVAAPMALNEMEINVYPNPVHDFMHVEFDLEKETQNCNITVFNSSGRVLLSKDMVMMEEGHHRETINMKGISKQLLLVKLTTDRHEKLFKVLKAE